MTVILCLNFLYYQNLVLGNFTVQAYDSDT